MSGASSLPPLKDNGGKYGLLALVLLLAGAGLWYVMREDPEPEPEAAELVPELPPREQFAPEIEIPEEEEAEPLPPDKEAAPRKSPARPEPVSPEEWICTGTIDAAQVRAIIQGGPSKQVQTCYERGLKTNNLLQGSMEVELTIGAGGTVKAVAVSGTLEDAQVYSCVKRVARTWKFPRPTGGCVRINAPFQMTPKL